MHLFQLLTIAITALAATFHLAAASPAPKPNPERITVSLLRPDDYNLRRRITLQTECQKLDYSNKHEFPQGIEGADIPDGYRCRFWRSDACNGGGTGDLKNTRTLGARLFVPAFRGIMLNSFKCYRGD
ncbi:uncharacterized protein DSM5745_10411 [Aspergillus mulundensis]|uniref:Uncharacterized protein n=1 Tax=Aspergillus mulundensis TaxID=1810919 RepID=A0A3D8QIY4_9EURO|nr:hypothetical protein DSM5745_10411 [Aspergillus mulundensis]RDW61739.1 hypothetical protein DSM5745_10411 [Aspergillus mulundensis]